eukprot:2148450-Rhodomonas_salina.1
MLVAKKSGLNHPRGLFRQSWEAVYLPGAECILYAMASSGSVIKVKTLSTGNRDRVHSDDVQPMQNRKRLPEDSKRKNAPL